MEPEFEEHWAQAWILLMKQVKCILASDIAAICVMRFASIVEETKM